MKSESSSKLSVPASVTVTPVDPPFVVNNDDGLLVIADTEPLSNPPDPTWDRTINIVVHVTKNPTDPSKFRAIVVVQSDSTSGFESMQFIPATDTLEVLLNTVTVNAQPYFIESNAIDIVPVNGNPNLGIELKKGNIHVGRKVHTISYIRIPFINESPL